MSNESNVETSTNQIRGVNILYQVKQRQAVTEDCLVVVLEGVRVPGRKGAFSELLEMELLGVFILF